MIARLVLAALALAGSPAFAQDAADPKLCASLNAILDRTPAREWPEEPGVSLEWDGGSYPCRTQGGVLSCNFFYTQMLSADVCKALGRDDPEWTARDAAARAYTQSRAAPALMACFAGASAGDWRHEDAFSASQGYVIKPPEKPAFRFGETNRRLDLGDSVCVFNSIGFEFDPAK